MPGDLGSPIHGDGTCSTIYGPVQSRRHGWSLGVNLGSPNKKICSWGCVYCQCGFGERRDLVHEDKRVERKDILASIKEAVLKNPTLDSVTFAGNCEPTQHHEFLEVVQDVRELKKSLGGKWTLNALSNGSELDLPQVLEGCELLDETWIKLDCGLDELFKRLNRPIDRVGGVAKHIERIKKLKDLYIQTLLWKCGSVPDLANFTPDNLGSLERIYLELQPKRIHITTISRVPAFAALQPVERAELETFVKRLTAQGLAVEVFV